MNEDDKSQFGSALVDVTRLFRREFDRRAARLSLTRAQWRCLKLIGHEEGLSQKDLAERLDMDPIAVGRTLDRLQKAGFIERRADPGDRRVWRLHMAPASSVVMDGVDRISAELRDEVLGAIDPADLATTVRVLATVKDHLQRLDRDSREPAAESPEEEVTSQSANETAAVAAAATPPAKRRVPLWLWLAGPLAVAGVFAWQALAGAGAVATDNAYVKAERVMIAPQVGGRVVEVAVAQNQAVAAGDLLFRLDREPLQLALVEAQARLAQVDDGASANRASIREAGAGLQSADENLRWAQQEYARIADLAGSGLLPRKALDDARHDVSEARSARATAVAAVERSRHELGGDAGGRTDQLPEYRAALAAVEKAQLDLDRADVYAPVAGVVGTHDLQAGEYLALGQAAMPLVASDGIWIEANFKETDLDRMRVGQPAQVRLDSYPGRTWQARVASISPASGAEFSVLPPQNASGNWVKVVQRIPVRLELVAAPDDAPVLRAGMSAEVEVELVDSAPVVAGVAAH